MFRIVTAIVAGLIFFPPSAWSQSTLPQEQASAARENSGNDDHSYLPPSMRTKKDDASERIASQEAEAAKRTAKASHGYTNRERHYTRREAPWGLFDD